MSAHLPCPFCGSTKVYHRFTSMGNAVACRVCKTIGPEVHISLGSTGAFELWNRRTLGRAEPPPTSEEPCSLCLNRGLSSGKCPGCGKTAERHSTE